MGYSGWLFRCISRAKWTEEWMADDKKLCSRDLWCERVGRLEGNKECEWKLGSSVQAVT